MAGQVPIACEKVLELQKELGEYLVIHEGVPNCSACDKSFDLKNSGWSSNAKGHFENASHTSNVVKKSEEKSRREKRSKKNNDKNVNVQQELGFKH
jgi:hypothetical protein